MNRHDEKREAKDCQHEDFEANVGVHRLTNDEGKVHAYMADVQVKCAQCGMPFTFPGLANGISSTEARVSMSGEVMRVPIKPQDQPHFSFFPGFNVTQTAAVILMLATLLCGGCSARFRYFPPNQPHWNGREWTCRAGQELVDKWTKQPPSLYDKTDYLEQDKRDGLTCRVK